jgi:hypothetical protein
MARRQRASRRFQFHKRGQLFIRTHNVTLSVVAVRINNPDCSPFAINRRDDSPAPTGFAEIVGVIRGFLKKKEKSRHSFAIPGNMPVLTGSSRYEKADQPDH